MNTGIDRATAAALAIGAKMATPGMEGKADFWDVWNEQGPDGIKARINAAAIPGAAPVSSWLHDAVKRGSVARFIDSPKPELDFVFMDSLLSSTVGILAGPGAAGKSTLLLLMLMAIATGKDILPGIFTPTRAGKVLGIFAEDCEEVLHHRIKTMADTLFFFDKEARGLLRENMCVVSVPGHDLRLFNDEQRKKAETVFYQTVLEIAKGIDDLRLLVIDPLSRFHGENENDNGAGTFFISLLERIAQATGAAVICSHHVGKFTSRDNKGSFNLETAMAQDAARGASGLTNGARWQCNLFGLPDDAVKKHLGITGATPGQYLALRVCKKNYGKPEPVHFLERGQGGMLQPVDPVESVNDADLDELIRDMLVAAIETEAKAGTQYTKRTFSDVVLDDWKKIDTRITGAAIKRTIESCLSKGIIFEVEGRNSMNRPTQYLSLNSEKTLLKTLLAETPETLLNTVNKTVNSVKSPDLQEQKHCKSEHCKSDSEQYVSTRNHDTVILLEPTPYGGVKHPNSVFPHSVMEDEENAEYI